MRKRHIVVSILTFLALASLIGVHVVLSCLIAISIVGSYGASARILLGDQVGRSVAATLGSIIFAMAAIGAGVGLIYLWALLLALPFLSSLSLWSAIFGGSAIWALVATWLEERGRAQKALRAIYG